MSTLPAWMYGDPADVAQLKEQVEINRVERQEREAGERMERERRQRFGLVSDETVRLVKQLRVREAVASVKGGKQ